MIDDPYKVLGISQGASEDEIKKAYRKKAKELHPDLHPDDPNADKKMNEVNDAYDMLMNPEKYAARRAQQNRQQSSYGGSQQYGQNNQNSQRSTYSSGGPGGWSSQGDWGPFGGFEDIFGFGRENAYDANAGRPKTEYGDSTEISRVIAEYNAGRYDGAISILTHIPSTGRNARWYYLSALCHQKQGNTVQALDHIQKAVQLDPNNRTYHQLLNEYREAGRTYETNAQGFNMQVLNFQKIICGCFALQFFCPFCGLRCI